MAESTEEWAETTRWAATCKDCRATSAAARRSGHKHKNDAKDLRREHFDYSDEWAQRTIARGGSRSDRCPECRKLHSTKIRAFPVAYIDIRAIGEAEGLSDPEGPSGPLGGLGPLPVSHKSTVSRVNLKSYALGLDDSILLKLLSTMRENQVVVLEAGTGTGKSTLAPFRMMNPPPNSAFKPTDYGPIVVTEPRIPATTEVAKFVGESMCFGHDPAECTSHIGPGYPVGYQCDGIKAWDDSCQLVYVTDGTMINWIKNGDLARYSVIVIDEAHERSENIDTILALLHQNLRRYPSLRVVIASATLDPSFFIEYFSDTAKGVAHVEVKAAKTIGYGTPLFPGATIDQSVLASGLTIDGVEYTGWAERASADDPTNLRSATERLLSLRPPPLPKTELHLLSGVDAARRCANLAFAIMKEVCAGTVPDGDIIAFLPGERECLKAKETLQELVSDKDLPVHSYWLMKATEASEKAKAMAACAEGEYKVVFASNLAETSLTIAGLRYVIDSGLIKQAKWNSSLASSSVPTEPHSKSGVRQRWGRVGRKTYGWVFPLYTTDQFKRMPKDTPAGSTQVNLENTVLTLISAGVDDLGAVKLPANFATSRRDSAGEELASSFSDELMRSQTALQLNGALTPEGHLTSLGRELDRSRLSTEQTIALMFADRLACMLEVALGLTVLGAGSMAGPQGVLWADYDRPAAWNVHARRCHEALAFGCEDELEFMLRLFSDWESAPNPASWAARWWLNQDRLIQAKEDALKMVEALAPGMSKRAERPFDLRLTDRARAVFSRALRSLHYRRQDDGLWYASAPIGPNDGVSVPANHLTDAPDWVVALSRQLPRPRWGEPAEQRPSIQGLVKVLPWAADETLEPFQLMMRVRDELRSADGRLRAPDDPSALLRQRWPVGAVAPVAVLKELRSDKTIRDSQPTSFAFGLPTLSAEGDTARPNSAGGRGARSKKRRARSSSEVAHSTSSSSFEEANADFRTTKPRVAGVDRPSEEVAAESRDVVLLEVEQVDELPDVVSYANVWRGRDVPAVMRSHSASIKESRADATHEPMGVVRGYQWSDISLVPIWDIATAAEANGDDPAIARSLSTGDELLVQSGHQVHDHFGAYQTLHSCSEAGTPNGRYVFYFDGPLLDELDRNARVSLPEGSRWTATITPGFRKQEDQAVSLISSLYAATAGESGLAAGNARTPTQVVAGRIAGTTVNARGSALATPVLLQLGNTSNSSPRMLVPNSQDAGLVPDAMVAVDLSHNIQARKSGKWPEDLLARLTKMLPADLRVNGLHLELQGPKPMSAETRDIILAQPEVNDDLATRTWRLWSSSHHLEASSARVAGSALLEPFMANVLYRSTFRSVVAARHAVTIDMGLESGTIVVCGGSATQISLAMADLQVVNSCLAVVFELPRKYARDEDVQAIITGASRSSDVVALYLDEKASTVYALVRTESQASSIERSLRNLTDSVRAVIQLSSEDSLRASTRTGGLRTVLGGFGDHYANLTSGTQRRWTVTLPSAAVLQVFVDRLKGALDDPSISIVSSNSTSLTVRRTQGQLSKVSIPTATIVGTASLPATPPDKATSTTTRAAISVEENMVRSVDAGMYPPPLPNGARRATPTSSATRRSSNASGRAMYEGQVAATERATKPQVAE